MDELGGMPDTAHVDEKSLGQAIQAARKQAGYTQQELCEKTDISYSTLAKIERGAIKAPSIFTVADIARVCQVSIESLLGIETISPQTTFQSQKEYKTALNGIRFVYFDINGCLVRFFQRAFTNLANETGASAELIENTFWHYNDAVCRGEMSVDEFNHVMGQRLGIEPVDWQRYYMASVDPINEMHECLTWVSEHFRVGLLSNIMPGFIEQMINAGLIPRIEYDAIIDSSMVGAIKPETRIYEIAAERSNVPHEDILFVDDSRSNLMAAEKLGWHVLWFDDYRPEESVARIKSALNF